MWRQSSSISWKWSSEGLLESSRPTLMGILNVTPDSFSDGGLHWTPRDAVERAIQMHREGAGMIDIGGESTRPGADRISSRDQIDRVVPVIEALRDHLSLPISIDTTSSEVAAAALSSGASVINDVSAGQEDDAMLSLAAERRCGLILMHRRVPPDEDSYSTDYEAEPEYGDVVEVVRSFLLQRAAAAESAGVLPESIMLDPGLGFGKSVEQNWQLINACSDLTALGYPVLAAASRKSFLTTICGPDVAPADRGPASVAASIIQFRGGCRLFRVHDVGLHAAGLAGAAESDSGPAMM